MRERALLPSGGMGFDPGDSGITATLTVESAPRVCPECGAHAQVLGGSYHVAKDTIELLQGPERTISELERLREILRVARESGAAPEEVKNTVEHEFPGWGPALAKLLVPKTPADFYALLAVILMALEMVLGDKQSKQTTNIEAEQVINNIVVQEAPPVPGQPQDAPSSNPAYGEKIGRNNPCPCESGVKFKMCHGANGETRYYGP
jgi:hypothetical protein